MFSDNDLLPISALQHLAFCERQCALIHVEREWKENRRTEEGRTLHEKVDEGYRAYRKGLKQFSGLRVRSLKLGLYGQLDVLEVVKVSDEQGKLGFLGLTGTWELHPVEFKRGKPKNHESDRVQVCAQALCLEEMTDTHIEAGSLFYGQLRRRTDVEFSSELRILTKALASRLQEMVSKQILPPPIYKRHCRSCSLEKICQPQLVGGSATEAYRKELFG